ncbi:glycosyltransferase [Polaromonas sp. CF318]|uniref:glycosyltransferase n=1 Tax=Polaromonas sp. CF318 TaxID=1144318 RepID=UPI0012FB660C|nr:glycosyltransferase [Polaromonas sp. CF318]
MQADQTNAPARSWVIRRIGFSVFWACSAIALALCLLWQKYLPAVLILAALFLAGLIYRTATRFAGISQNLVDHGVAANETQKKDSLVSVIICSVDPVKYELVCSNLRERFGDSPYEIIGIHDAKSLCEGYNRGIGKSRGDILIFCHDDIEIISPSFSSLVRTHLQTFDVIGCAGTSRLKDSKWMSSGDPYVHGVLAYPAANAWPSDLFHVSVWGGPELTQVKGIQALDGFFIAANRRVVDSVQFDEETFDGFHGYDTDFTYAAFLHGFEVAVCKDILIAHKSTVGDFEGVYKTYASRFREKYKDHLPEKASDDTTVQVDFPYVSRAQMLKAWV